jgi:formiminotetrahydrofolate cyclodeaminase
MQKTYADGSIEEFITGLSSDAMTPGAGAAGAVVLAIACACAAKAATLSQRHVDSPAELDEPIRRLTALRSEALAAADEDAAAFAAQLRSQNAEAASRLEACGTNILCIADSLEAECVGLQGRVHATLAGDLVAAASLLAAARRIQARNLAEGAAPPMRKRREEGDFSTLIDECGLGPAEVAAELDVDPEAVLAWMKGREEPPRAVQLALRHLTSIVGHTTR